MSNSSVASKISLKNFFIYNVNFGDGDKEEEEEKIFYYYPKEASMDMKLKEIGLTEAIIKFTENFSPDLCDALQTEKTKKIFFQPEENFWMIMTINVPYGPKTADVMEGMAYLGSQVQIPVYKAVLRQAYLTAKLFIGPFQSILDKNNGQPAVLKLKLEEFFRRYLLDLKIKDCDIIDLFQGVQFLPLDKPTFLRGQSLVNLVEANFRVVSQSLLLFQDQIVWSGLGAEDAQVVFRYLVNSLFPTHFKVRTTMQTFSANNPTRFVTGPDSLTDLVYTDKVPKVYLGGVAEPGFYHLVVYRIKELTICMLIPSKEILKLELYRQLDAFLCGRMDKVCFGIKDYQNQPVTTDAAEPNNVRYVYFNSMNLATKSSIHDKKLGVHPISPELLSLLVDIHQHHERLAKSGVTSTETVVKTFTDHWVVGKMSNSRQFYITLERKKTSLKEVSDEVKRICDAQLKNIFFHV